MRLKDHTTLYTLPFVDDQIAEDHEDLSYMVKKLIEYKEWDLEVNMELRGSPFLLLEDLGSIYNILRIASLETFYCC